MTLDSAERSSSCFTATAQRYAVLASAVGVLSACILFTFYSKGDRSGLPVERIVVGYSREGRPIELHTIGKSDEVCLLVIASIHGSEPAGTPLGDSFIAWLRQNPSVINEKQVCIIPVANPDGLSAGTRTNSAGVDINRNFPANNRVDRPRFGSQALSEPETRALHHVIEALQPAAVISIHQPLSCIDYDGPAKGLADAMAASCDLPVKKLGARPGSLGAYFGDTLRRPIITLELPRHPHPNLWKSYGSALVTAIKYLDQ